MKIHGMMVSQGGASAGAGGSAAKRRKSGPMRGFPIVAGGGSRRSEGCILSRCLPSGKADRPVGGEAAVSDRLPRLRHQPAVEADVVQRQKRRPQHLPGHKQVVDISPAEMAAGVTRTTGLQRRRISLVAGIAE